MAISELELEDESAAVAKVILAAVIGQRVVVAGQDVVEFGEAYPESLCDIDVQSAARSQGEGMLSGYRDRSSALVDPIREVRIGVGL